MSCSMSRSSLAIIVTAAVVGCSAAEGQAIRTNAGFNTKSIPANDDGSAPLEPIGFTINFFGKTRGSAYVNNNGNITFDSSLATYTPFGLDSTQREIIAPFFADVDTRNPVSKLVTYGQDTVNGHKAFGANFINVGYYAVHADKLNSFQVVLIDRSETGAGNFDLEFNYAKIQWETGDASGGVSGYGGTPAVVGWSNGTGDPGTSYQLPGSLQSGAFLDGGPYALVNQTVNAVVSGPTTAVQGRLTFRARDGVLSPGLSITSSVLPDATVGTTYTTLFSATGANAPFQWALLPDVTTPPGLTLSADGTYKGVPTQPGTYSFTLSVTANTDDGQVTAYQRGSITVHPGAVTILNTCPLQGGTVGSPYSVTLQARGSSSGYLWSVDDPYSLPPGIGLSPAGQLAGTPMSAGTYIFNLRASTISLSTTRPAQSLCRMTVQPSAVQMTSGCALPNATVGVPYAQLLSTSGGYAPYRYSLVGQLPTGLALTSDGLVAGTPVFENASSFEVDVADSRGGHTSQACSVTVSAPAFNLPSVCPLPAAVTGTAYNKTLPPGYVWSLSGTLPAGLTLTPDGSLSGTPMSASLSQFLLIATDPNGNPASQICSLAVTRGSLAVTGCPLPAASAGQSYQANINALGGSGPYTFTAAGSLPPGISVSPNGFVSGSSTAGGSYPFDVTVRDSNGQTFTQACNLNVTPSVLHVTTACPLPDARLGQSYSAQLQASGGVAPYQFEFFGYLPDGLQAASDGTLSGTPTALGGDAFQVAVTDSQNKTVTSPCSVGVGLPAVPQISITGLPATVQPAATNIAVTAQLAAAYTQPIYGQFTLDVLPNTQSSQGAANQADPRLRFANGQTSMYFVIPPGTTKITLPLVSTGTVASIVIVSLVNVGSSGVPLPLHPSPVIFSIAPAAPVITSACYTVTQTGVNVQVNGYSTTRELTQANVTIGTSTFKTDVSGIAAAYFSAPQTIRAGGSFALTLPYQVDIGSNNSISSATMNLSNTVGAAGSRTIQACQ
jgi:hypothetical protein